MKLLGRQPVGCGHELEWNFFFPSVGKCKMPIIQNKMRIKQKKRTITEEVVQEDYPDQNNGVAEQQDCTKTGLPFIHNISTHTLFFQVVHLFVGMP